MAQDLVGNLMAPVQTPTDEGQAGDGSTNPQDAPKSGMSRAEKRIKGLVNDNQTLQQRLSNMEGQLQAMNQAQPTHRNHCSSGPF